MSSSKNQGKRKIVSTMRPEDSFLKEKGHPSKKHTRFQDTGNTSDYTFFDKIEKCSDSMSVDDGVLNKSDISRKSAVKPQDHHPRKALWKESTTASCSDAVELEEAESTLKTESITFGCSLCYSEFTVENEYNEHMCKHLARGEGVAPPDFEAMLYGDDSGDEGKVEEECLFEEDSEDDEIGPLAHDSPTLPYSPIRHSTPKLSPVQDWSGSRSPLDEADPLGVVIAFYAEDGTRLSDEFFAPDSHVLFDSAECLSSERFSESNIDRGNRFGRGSRGRGRCRRGRVGSRGQVRGFGRERRRHHPWQPGQHLEEIYMTDDDVPPELREMVNDLMRRRQARVEEEIEARRVRASELLHEGHNSESKIGDVFDSAIDGRDKSLVEGVDPHFEWSPMETFQSVEETFTPQRTGSVASYSNPYDAFRSFWDDDILQIIADETNRYASHIQSASFQASWHPTNAHELLCLFAFWLMTGIIRMPTICSYFSVTTLLKTEIFSRITTLKRYNSLRRALHFVDTSVTASADLTNRDAASFDPLHRLRPVIDHLNIKFRENYVLSRDICIDESLTLWKGRLKQYIRSKAVKYGIKTFELCESATGYLWSFKVYTRKDDSVEPDVAKSTAVVLKLMRPLLNKGYRLFMDNWFNSPLLARILKRNGTDCVGTLRASRADVPKLVSHAPLKLGQLVARHSGDVCVLSWQDKKRINMISTCHGSATGLASVSSSLPSRLEQFKPQAVLDYNRAMGGVDLKDHMLEPYMLERKRGAKWYLKLFKRLLNCSIHNSRVLLESSLKARQDNLKFRLELVHAILLRHHPFIPVGRKADATRARTGHIHNIVHHTHWPVRVPQTEKDQAKNCNSRQKCVVCLREGRKCQKTFYKCEDCNVALCIENCFKKYHTIAPSKS